MKDQALYRMMDANLNRAKEGLRICEDVCRFIYNKKQWTKAFKIMRHQLTAVAARLNLEKLVEARQVEGDIGRETLDNELARRKIADIFYANSQRVKESIRVLEECAKLRHKLVAEDFKGLRYRMYALEKKITTGN